VLDYLPEGLGRNRIYFAGRRLVDEVKQRRKRIAKIEASPATVTDVENAFEFRVQSTGVGVRRRLPIDRMPGRRVEAALAWWRHVRICRAAEVAAAASSIGWPPRPAFLTV
jgi:hypothetical protein